MKPSAPSSSERRSSGYRVRLTPAEKAELEERADGLGVTVADVLRVGALLLLDGLEGTPDVGYQPTAISGSPSS